MQREIENAGAMQASDVIIMNKMKGINPGRRRGKKTVGTYLGHGGEKSRNKRIF